MYTTKHQSEIYLVTQAEVNKINRNRNVKNTLTLRKEIKCQERAGLNQ